MSLADVTFINMCKDVIENGTSTEGEKVRPVWEDGTLRVNNTVTFTGLLYPDGGGVLLYTKECKGRFFGWNL